MYGRSGPTISFRLRRIEGSLASLPLLTLLICQRYKRRAEGRRTEPVGAWQALGSTWLPQESRRRPERVRKVSAPVLFEARRPPYRRETLLGCVCISCERCRLGLLHILLSRVVIAGDGVTAQKFIDTRLGHAGECSAVKRRFVLHSVEL